MAKKLTKIELWEKLAQPDENGVTRWVSVDEFVGEYQGLQLLNGAGWSRDDGPFGRKYIIERDKRDMEREESPLRQADDAVLVDSSDMSIEEVATKIMEIAESKL